MEHLFLQPKDVTVEVDGTQWVPLIFGAERSDGTWEAWIEFRRVDDGRTRATGRETTQPNRRAVEYWATGLEPVFYEGAFDRSRQI